MPPQSDASGICVFRLLVHVEFKQSGDMHHDHKFHPNTHKHGSKDSHLYRQEAEATLWEESTLPSYRIAICSWKPFPFASSVVSVPACYWW
jgi:hypothetical protein